MKNNLLLYLSAGFNMGAFSAVLLRNLGKKAFLSGKEIPAILLSGLAAASAIGFVLSNKDGFSGEGEDLIDVHQNPARQLETFLV